MNTSSEGLPSYISKTSFELILGCTKSHISVLSELNRNERDMTGASLTNAGVSKHCRNIYSRSLERGSDIRNDLAGLRKREGMECHGCYSK
ncbi:MAG TPA: hypothetical protein VI033_00050 [Candidatus Nitrosopolaris sp.]